MLHTTIRGRIKHIDFLIIMKLNFKLSNDCLFHYFKVKIQRYCYIDLTLKKFDEFAIKLKFSNYIKVVVYFYIFQLILII